MNLGDCIDELAARAPSRETADTNVTTGRFPRYLKESIREISRMYDWSFLRKRFTISLASGESAKDLPGEPVDAANRMTITVSNYETPLMLMDIFMATQIWSSTDTGRPAAYYLQQKQTGDPGAKILQAVFLPTTDDAYTCTLDGYFYLPELPDENSDNVWLVEHPYMVIEHAMINVRKQRNQYDKSMIHLAEFRRLYDDATHHDAMKQLPARAFLRPGFDSGPLSPINTVVDPWRRGLAGW